MTIVRCSRSGPAQPQAAGVRSAGVSMMQQQQQQLRWRSRILTGVARDRGQAKQAELSAKGGERSRG